MLEIERRVHEVPGIGNLEYGFLSPTEHAEVPKNIVYFLPHGKTLNHALPTWLGSETRDEIDKTANLYLLPNHSWTEHPYDLGKTDRKKVSQGDLSPVSELDVALIRGIGDTASTLLVGPSFGGSRGAGAIARLEPGEQIKGAILLGAPNVVPKEERGINLLRWYFMSQAEYIQPNAKANNAPESVLRAEGLESGILQYLKLNAKLLNYASYGNIMPTNRAFNDFFLSNTFFRDVSRGARRNPDTPIVIGTSTNDPVSPAEKFRDYKQRLYGESGYYRPENIRVVEYPGNHLDHGNPGLIAGLNLAHCE